MKMIFAKRPNRSYDIAIDKDWLYDKYWNEKLTIYEISLLVGCSTPTINHRLKRYGIKVRSRKEAWNEQNKASMKRKVSASQKKYWSDENNKKRRSGANGPGYGKPKFGVSNPNWRGGKGSEEYDIKFTRKLRTFVRNLYGRKCYLCGWHTKLFVHHINYNKHDTRIGNFVALCRWCHAKTNGHREFWTKYFNSVIVRDPKVYLYLRTPVL